jgi:hypothetical protein
MMLDLPSVDFTTAPFCAAQPQRTAALLDALNALTEWHRERCPDYALMIDGVFGRHDSAERIEDVPYLPVAAFKHYQLRSVPESAVVRRLTSSGTTGQQVSQVFLDAETSRLQVRALSSVVQDFVGRHRLPMLIVDQQDVVRGKAAVSARAAGVLGFSNFGRDHTYALDAEMRPRWSEISAFLERHTGSPILLFGFTWVIWQFFVQTARSEGRRLDFGESSILVHGGGWKRLLDQQVDNASFKATLAEQFGIRRVSNYYGMVEQIGSVFMECDHGVLHVPAFADVLMRSVADLSPSDDGAVEVLSLLPRSYPGHAILTEDLGTVLGCDDCQCGRKGKYVRIRGRIPKAELRGCSDVRGS